MPEEKVIQLVVGEDHSGVRIDKVLRDLVEGYSRTYLKELIEKGYVRVSGRVVDKPREVVEKGNEIRIRLIPKKKITAAPRQFPLVVLYQDDFLAVIDKPAGMPAHPAPQTRKKTVADAALALFGEDLPRGQGEDRPGIVHRLDTDTTGVMVLAKTMDAFHSLRAQFKARTVEKEYRAIVRGELRFDSDHVEGLIGRHPVQRDRMAMTEDGGKESSTFYEALERFEGFTYVRCLPKTGRTHQLRVHLSHLGHPIVGDKMYRTKGTPWSTPEGAPPARRQFLHAFALSLDHPETGERVHFEAELHPDMKDFLNFLRRTGPQARG